MVVLTFGERVRPATMAMFRIHLVTTIEASIERVFNLSRSIDLHLKSMDHSGEQAIDGVTTGLIGLNDVLTWQASHLGKKRSFTSKITSMVPFTFFEDRMISGDLKSVRHEHHFKKPEGRP